MFRPQRLICKRSIAWFLVTVGVVVAGKVCADQTYTPPPNVWDTTTTNWSGAVWNNSTTNNAIFGNSAVTVDVNGAIQVGNMTFNSNGWNISDPTNDGSLTLGASSTLTVTNTTDTATISAVITGGSVTVNNGYNGMLSNAAGVLVLSAANTYSGDTTINNGVLKITNSNALGNATGAVNITTATTTTTTSAGSLVLGNGVNVANKTLFIAGSGTNFAGALQADAGANAGWSGTIKLNAGARVGAQLGGTLTLSGSIQDGTSNVLAIAGAPGVGTPGVVVISGSSNTYTGATQIIRGVLKIGVNNALPVTTTLDVDQSTAAEDATFDLNGFSQTISALTRSGGGAGTGGSFITNNGAAPSVLTVNQTTTTTYSGIIKDGSSTVAITKSGTGVLTLSGANNYSGATSVTAGGLTLGSGGSLNNTAINVTSTATGAFSENAAAAITGTSSFTASAGTSGLNGANTFTGAVTLSGTAILNVNSNGALGSTVAGTVVQNGARIVLTTNGLKITGETLTINGSGGNNNGALQTSAGVSAEWAGNIIVAQDASRIGPVGGGTLTISGVISSNPGVTTILFSRGSGTTVLNAVNTYTADTQLFADTPTGPATLKMGVDNAISSSSKFSLISNAASGGPAAMTIDLNGHILTLKSIDTSANYTNGAAVIILNSAATPGAVLGLADPNAANIINFNGVLADGVGGLSLVKGGAYTQVLLAANTYTGSTTVNSGTLQIGGSAITTGASATLASTAFTLNGGTFALNNAGTGNNSTNRIADTSVFTMKGGAFSFTGSATAPSSETVGSFALNSGLSRITVTSGAGNLATVTAGQISRTASSGVALINGTDLGKNDTSTVGRLFSTTSPTLVGTTDAQNAGINTAAQNTKIVPYFLGEATSTTGGTGTQTGTADTFVTYNPQTGYRPLNPTDEFTQNSFVAGNNTRATTAASVNTSVAINSLLLDGGAVTIASGQTLKVTSGAILFSTGATSSITGGTLDFGSAEGIITLNSGAAANPTINSLITGTAGVSYYGTATLVIGIQQSTYSGNTLLAVSTVIPQTSSVGPAGAPTSGPFGTGTIILGGSAIRAATSVLNGLTLANPVSFLVDTTITTSTGADQPLIFTGPVTLSNGTRILTQNSAAATVFTGNIGESTPGSGLIITSTNLTTTPGAVVLSGTNTYTGPTQLKNGTVVLTGSILGSVTTIGDAANVAKSAVFGGNGTLGSVIVGAAAGNTGAALKPHANSNALDAGLTLHTGSLTFNSGAHLSLLIGRTSAFTGSTGDGAAGGDVSDHIATTGPISLLNGGDLQLSLLTNTGYTAGVGDVFFLTINSGGAVQGTFNSLNGTATNLSEGAIFQFGTLAYEITYQANFATNSFTGGNDIALEAVVVPEPGTLVTLFGGLGCLLGVQRMRRPRSRKAAR